jgi:release factor glutamine methyltransferase
VEEVIDWLEKHPSRRSMADIGTGSGAIAVTCADRFSDLKVTAIDISPEALVIANKNAARNAVADQINFIQNDMLIGIKQKFDIIAANLPYHPIRNTG